MYGYGYPIPDDAAPALLASAHEHRLALTPPLAEEADKLLRGLRSATIIRDEDAAEARAAFAMLRNHLADVPLDILSEACRLYCNAPGRRFFPRSAGELRTFVNPLMKARAARALRLDALAKRAAEEQDERERLAADPATPEGIAAVMVEFGIRATPAPAATQSARPEPTIDDYLALGLNEAEARDAMAERRRLLSRSPAKPFSQAAASTISTAADAAMGE